MEMFETEAKVGPCGVLTLADLPFGDGEAVHVRIERKPNGPASNGPRVLGLHQGSVVMRDDFDEPLPDSFWLGEDSGDETSA